MSIQVSILSPSLQQFTDSQEVVHPSKCERAAGIIFDGKKTGGMSYN